MRKEKLENTHPELYDGYNALPRYLYRAYTTLGTVDRNEYFTLLLLFSKANPYGKCSITNLELAQEMFGSEKKRDYARKIIGSLKAKSFLHFDSNKGNRSKYEVTLYFFMRSGGNWILPDKMISNISSEVLYQNPKLLGGGGIESTVRIDTEDVLKFRGGNNKNDNENYNEKTMLSIKEIIKGKKEDKNIVK